MGLDREQFWVVDVEGNGANPPEIVELAMVQVIGLEVTPVTRNWLIRPHTPISPHVTRIHGLTNDDVRDAPYLSDIEDDLHDWLDDAAIVGHNVRVEVEILARSLGEWAPSMAIDTLWLSRALLPNLSSHSLASVGDALGHSEAARIRTAQNLHSALYDATLTAFVFVDLFARAIALGKEELLREADILSSSQPRLL